MIFRNFAAFVQKMKRSIITELQYSATYCENFPEIFEAEYIIDIQIYSSNFFIRRLNHNSVPHYRASAAVKDAGFLDLTTISQGRGKAAHSLPITFNQPSSQRKHINMSSAFGICHHIYSCSRSNMYQNHPVRSFCTCSTNVARSHGNDKGRLQNHFRISEKQIQTHSTVKFALNQLRSQRVIQEPLYIVVLIPQFKIAETLMLISMKISEYSL